METGMTTKPALHLGMFVGSVVVYDHVDLFVGRDHVIDDAEKLQPFLMTMAVVAHGNHLTFQRIKGSKQRGGAVALVVVGHSSATSLLLAAELESSHLVRFQPMSAPDAAHAGLADAGCRRH